MSDTPETTPQNAPEVPSGTEAPEAPETPAQEPQGTPDDGGNEAAKYRRKLRDTEAERDALAGQLDTLRRQIAEDIAGQQISKPAALWSAGVTVADLLDENGTVDAEKVHDAVGKAAEDLGLTRAPRAPQPNPAQGSSGQYRSPNGNETAWQQLLRGA